MAHGYLGDGYGTHGEIDPDRDNDRDRQRHDQHRDRARSQDWRSRDNDRDRVPDWRSRDSDRMQDRNSGMFFGERDSFREQRDWQDRNEQWPQDRWPESRGRASGYNRQAEDWSGQHRNRSSGERFSANPDDHYMSWRDRHMADLDRDYADYCREREQQFHNEFDSWRRERRGNPQPLRTGMTQTGMSHDPSGLNEAEMEDQPAKASEPDPVSEATLGTNSSRGAR